MSEQVHTHQRRVNVRKAHLLLRPALHNLVNLESEVALTTHPTTTSLMETCLDRQPNNNLLYHCTHRQLYHTHLPLPLRSVPHSLDTTDLTSRQWEPPLRTFHQRSRRHALRPRWSMVRHQTVQCHMALTLGKCYWLLQRHVMLLHKYLQLPTTAHKGFNRLPALVSYLNISCIIRYNVYYQFTRLWSQN